MKLWLIVFRLKYCIYVHIIGCLFFLACVLLHSEASISVYICLCFWVLWINIQVEILMQFWSLTCKTKQNKIMYFPTIIGILYLGFLKKSSFGISKHWYSFLNCGSVIKRIQLLLERHCRLKALQVHTWFCSWERVLSCESRMMQKMDETEFKEQ